MQFVMWASQFMFEYGLGKVLDRMFSNLTFIRKSTYKRRNLLIPDIDGLELLKVLMYENDLSRKDLATIFGTSSRCHDILQGRQQLTHEELHKLSNYFMISPLAFFPNKEAFG